MRLYSQYAEGPGYGFLHPVVGYQLKADVRSHYSEELVAGCWRGRAYCEDQQKPAEVLQYNDWDHRSFLTMARPRMIGAEMSAVQSKTTVAVWLPPRLVTVPAKKRTMNVTTASPRAFSIITSTRTIRRNYYKSRISFRVGV